MNPINREQQAETEIGQTTFSRGVPAFLVLMLLTTLFGVFLLERVQRDSVPLIDEVLHLAPSPEDIRETIARDGAYEGFFALNRGMFGNMKRLSSDLERNSPLRRALLSPMNQLFTGVLGAQNADVARGQRGWLFYAPAIAHVTGPGFLTYRAPRQGNPVEALANFSAQLAARGITLVVVPLPAKASIYPKQLAPGCSATEALQNPSFAPFLEALKTRGVLACDVAPALLAAKANTQVYLARDSHWTPEGMHVAAQQITDFLSEVFPSVANGHTAYTATPKQSIENVGDLVAMLVPDKQADRKMKETVQHQSVLKPDGSPWAPDTAAEILLLGDSFSNIYGLEGMGWGANGGLPAWLSLLMQQPVDAITQNGDGAHATRLRLNQALQRGEDRLSGKKVLVFAFAARELSLGDWKPDLQLPLPAAVKAPRMTTKTVEVEGTIAAITRPPEAGSVPYKDCIVNALVTGVRGAEGVPERILLYQWGMRDNRWTAAARQRPGDPIRISIEPWEAVSADLDRFNRVDLEEGRMPQDALWWSPTMEYPSTAEIVPAPSASNMSGATLSELVAKMTGANQLVHRGENDWLFFRPELHFLVSQPVWDRADLHGPGPLDAILDFHRQLETRDIQLLLVPVPAKATIYQDRLGLESPPDGYPKTLKEFFSALRRENVDVLDLHECFTSARRDGGPDLYCHQDTHWSPRACELAAKEIARRFGTLPVPEAASAPKYQREQGEITIQGDLRELIPEPRPTAETLPIAYVRSESPTTDRASPVVLLGDSHALVFHAGGDMHAESAGLPDHLAAALGTPVDLVAVKGSGATAPRVNLARRHDNLAGKKRIIWCFALRELTESNTGWRRIPVIQSDTEGQ